jgi:D-ornithine 4,5-aminomutase subunit beta
VLFLEEILAMGGYFAAVEQGQFVDSGYFPERHGDGIARDPQGGVAAQTIVRRAPDYGAPVCSHFGQNVYARQNGKACAAYGGCTLCEASRIQYIDELDDLDNVHQRLQAPLAEQAAGLLRPEVERAGDGVVCVTLFVPEVPRLAEAAALKMAAAMGLQQPEVISTRLMHPAEGSLFEIKGRLAYAVHKDELVLPPAAERMPEADIATYVRPRHLHVVAATVGEDEHSVGLREILDIKHGGIEKYGFHCHDLGTSVPVSRLLDAAEETGACAVLISTIMTHHDIHTMNMQRLHDLAVERGIRDKLLLIAGGTQVSNDLARACGLDAGFGRGTKGQQVATFLVKRLMAAEGTAGHTRPG